MKFSGSGCQTRLLYWGVNYDGHEKSFIVAASKVKPVRNNFAKNVIVVSSLLRRRRRSCAQTNSQKPKYQKLFQLTKSNLNCTGSGCQTRLMHSSVNYDVNEKSFIAAATKVKPVRNNFAKDVIVVSSLLRRR